MEHKSNADTICNWNTWYIHQRIDKGTGEFGKLEGGRRRDHPNDSIIKVCHSNSCGKHSALLIAAQNNAIRTNHIKARIDKTQQNSKCRLCGDRDETIHHIISERSKLAQKECKCRHDWVGKVIHWEMCKKFKFDHTNKWYMYNPSPVLENYTHELLWDFDIYIDHLISARRPDLIIIIKKENMQNCRFCCPGWLQNKSERMWKEV